MPHLREGSLLLDWVMNAFTLVLLFTVKCWVARLNVTGYTSSQTKTYTELLLFSVQWALSLLNGYMMETSAAPDKFNLNHQSPVFLSLPLTKHSMCVCSSYHKHTHIRALMHKHMCLLLVPLPVSEAHPLRRFA